MKTPVALFVFNRPDTTYQVFETIRQAKPIKLLVVADGPRPNRSGEVEKCAEVRSIVNRVDWDCEVITNYADSNLGCKRRVSSGLDWVFNIVEEAIILEDDCLPDPSFYRFCEELLEAYRHDGQVMHIGGTNLNPMESLDCSFLYSRLVPIWGWATWRRAWQLYDIKMKLWPSYRESSDIDYFGTQSKEVYRVFQANYCNQVDSWDGQWAFSCVVNNGLSIIPKTNLVKNIGFRNDATHTTKASAYASTPIQPISFPLIKPTVKSPNQDFDEKYLKVLNNSSAVGSWKGKVKWAVNSILR
jgi:hypothetical protein